MQHSDRPETARESGGSFLSTIMGNLTSLGDFTSRAMFGGHGLYWHDVIFGIVFDDRLYLKVDDRRFPRPGK